MEAAPAIANATAVAITNVAEAALYFDQVVSVGGFLNAIFRVHPILNEPDHKELIERLDLTQDAQNSLLPPALRHDEKFHEEGRKLLLSEVEELRRVMRRHAENPSASDLHFDAWLSEVRAVVRKYGLTDAPLIVHEGFLPRRQDNSGTCFAATMTSIQVVDTTKLSWDHILEFRKDPGSRLKLRRLRLLFAENYADKDRLYVEDDLHRRLDDYTQVVKEWGFETRAQVISLLLRSKWLAGGAGGSIISALAGAPVAALMAASGGVVVEAANVVLEVVRRHHALAELTRQNPISYLSDLANKAGRIE